MYIKLSSLKAMRFELMYTLLHSITVHSNKPNQRRNSSKDQTTPPIRSPQSLVLYSIRSTLIFLTQSQTAFSYRPELYSPGTMSPKRTLLWDWTLTRDYPSSPALHQAVSALKPNSPIASIVNWNAWRPSELPAHLPFQPMVRTPAQLEGSEWTMLQDSLKVELARPGNGEVILLSFNEPERIVGLSAAKAAGLWKSMILPLRKQHTARLKIVSPSCASDAAGAKWLEEFMKLLAEGEKPDYIGAHFYTSQNQPVDHEITAAKTFLESMHTRYNHPVVVSEIASTSRNASDVEKFSHEIAKWMEGQGWIKEYAFFGVMREVADGFVSPVAQMMDNEGHWTKLGKWWVGLS
ncbi:glycosyl hydrolase catalytic core-domain-containing protein [Xylariales sp. AK1849]|nr:glycosyl hydrolase catalytic core-domain-containing protein [Xylariales sp. AK1849]